MYSSFWLLTIIRLEHNLGLTCDPIDGLVQVPCIVSAIRLWSLATLTSVTYRRREIVLEVSKRLLRPRVIIQVDFFSSAVKAVTAAQLSMASHGVYSVTLDEAIEAMRLTAADMSVKYRETSLSGLAVSCEWMSVHMVGC